LGTKKGQRRKTARRAYVKVKSHRRKKPKKSGTKKGQVRKTARRAYKK